ncbi:hypothetical protein [Roseovarius aestuarii]|uniref:Uncharacterized protein n=1 Tax=Roseovarius aestuarii TaxID=475083 RepID=A0A1X7BWW6_9RHOB|nr:hypothetical protein [Roseovarius aestuarii]SMC14141.1 hypothetical protein ROA7745_04006 [Roseovarius aestuarii]
MRTTLITLQVLAISLFAVLGAQGSTHDRPACPVSAAAADRNCDR